MLDWSAYLTSICDRYAQWWRVYTLTDVVGQQPAVELQTPHTQSSDLLLNFDLGLMVETIEPKQPDSKQEESKQEESKQEESKRPKTERLDVLEGLRKYAPNHVLLVGRPGSGKSTALARLLLEEAEEPTTRLSFVTN